MSGYELRWLMDGQGPKHPYTPPPLSEPVILTRSGYTPPPLAEPVVLGAAAAPEGGERIDALLERLSTALGRADPAVRQEVIALVTRYMENPDAGSRIAAAIELLLSKDAPDDPSPR